MNDNKKINECTVILVNDFKTPYKINFKEFHIEDKAIKQLKNLREGAKSRIDEDEIDDIFRIDYEALDYAIKLIENMKEE